MTPSLFFTVSSLKSMQKFQRASRFLSKQKGFLAFCNSRMIILYLTNLSIIKYGNLQGREKAMFTIFYLIMTRNK